jgi:hypothetical protein
MYPKLSETEKYFTFKGKMVFKTFINALKFHEPGLAPVQDETGWYHINTEGKAIYNQRYKRTFGYYFNLAAVIDKDNNWFHIDAKGQRIYSQKFSWCGNFQENLCTVRDFNGNYFHINKNVERIYNRNYRYAGDFKDGYAAVRINNGLYKHIDYGGNDLNGKLFKDLGVYHKSYATAKDETGWFHIDKEGKEIYKERYALIEPFYNGFALVESFDGKKFIINEKGEIILKI